MDTKKIVSSLNKVKVYDRRSKSMKTTTVHEAVKMLLSGKKNELAMLDSNNFNITVKMNRNGFIEGIILNPKGTITQDNEPVNDSYSPPIISSFIDKHNQKYLGKLECLAQNVKTGQEAVEDSDSDEGVCWWENAKEEVDTWWKSKPKEELDNLDLTLDLNDFDEELFTPDAMETTQIPPKPNVSSSKNASTSEAVMENLKSQDADYDSELTWKNCWNCRAPQLPFGIHTEDPDNLRINFCCDKSREARRIKPTNDVIEWGPKSYPYDSWVNHGCS